MKIYANRWMKKNVFAGRKAESMLVDFWAILVFAIIAIIIFILIILSRSDNTQNIQEEFQNKDVHLMLNSFLRAPYDNWGDKNMAEIIVEDSVKGDYSRTNSVFEKFFRGVETYSDNPIGAYGLAVNDKMIYTLDLKNKEFMEQAAKSSLANLAGLGGILYKSFSGYKVSSLTYIGAYTTIPGMDGQDIKVALVVVYDQKHSKKFE